MGDRPNAHNVSKAGSAFRDVDFLIENSEHILMVEYKNAKIFGAKKKKKFDPNSDDRVNAIAEKYYDALHYLTLLGKEKPVKYVYVLEYPGGDAVTRKRLRNRIKPLLPFQPQKELNTGKKLIDSFDILSIEQWNQKHPYNKYPIQSVS